MSAKRRHTLWHFCTLTLRKREQGDAQELDESASENSLTLLCFSVRAEARHNVFNRSRNTQSSSNWSWTNFTVDIWIFFPLSFFIFVLPAPHFFSFFHQSRWSILHHSCVSQLNIYFCFLVHYLHSTVYHNDIMPPSAIDPDCSLGPTRVSSVCWKHYSNGSCLRSLLSADSLCPEALSLVGLVELQ